MLPILIVGLLGVVLAIWLLSKGNKKVEAPKVEEVIESSKPVKAKPVLKKKETVAPPAPKPAAKAKPVKKAVAKAAPAKKAGKKL
jgi:hypothetical protein